MFGYGANRRRRDVLPTYRQSVYRQQGGEGKRTMREEDMDLDQFIGAYDHSTKAESRRSGTPSSMPSLGDGQQSRDRKRRRQVDVDERLSVGHSLYSEITGQPRQGPEPRQPVKRDMLSSRFSATTLGSSAFSVSPPSRPAGSEPTEAEAYAMAVRPALAASPPLGKEVRFVTPTNTGDSEAMSKNPFRH